jgi:hypothetical protein
MCYNYLLQCSGSAQIVFCYLGFFFLDPDSVVKAVENTVNYKTISWDLFIAGNDA